MRIIRIVLLNTVLGAVLAWCISRVLTFLLVMMTAPVRWLTPRFHSYYLDWSIGLVSNVYLIFGIIFVVFMIDDLVFDGIGARFRKHFGSKSDSA